MARPPRRSGRPAPPSRRPPSGPVARPRLLLGLLALTAVVLTAVDAGRGGSPLDVLRRGADAAVGPAVRAVGAGVRALPDLGGSGDAEALRRDNDALRRRVLELEGRQAQAAELDALQRLAGASGWRTVVASVVGYGAATPFERTVLLDAGTRRGLRDDLTVTTGLGLVGRTVRCGPDTCRVALLTDPTVSVGVRLNDAPRSFGLLSGAGHDARLALVEGADPGVLRPGAAVVTAGSDTFVPGVPVGRLTDVPPVAAGTVPTASLAPYADLTALDLVQVVVPGAAP